MISFIHNPYELTPNMMSLNERFHIRTHFKLKNIVSGAYMKKAINHGCVDIMGLIYCCAKTECLLINHLTD